MKIQTGALLLVIGLLFGCTDPAGFVLEQGLDESRSQSDREYIDQRFNELQRNLGVNETEQETSDDMVSASFPSASFPRETCGDPLPSDKSLYPINYYAVFVPDEGDNLEVIRSEFCADAFSKLDKATGENVIQVASFYTEKVHEFVSLMEKNFGEGAKLGKPSVVNYNN
jgi:hypothetical protein